MKMKCNGTLKKASAVIFSSVLLLGSLPVQNISAQEDLSPTSNYGLKNPTLSNRVGTWDCIYFGNYWQNDTNGDGKADKNDAKEPIKWRVLSVDGDDAFLLADQNLDWHLYDNLNTENVTWEKSMMRSWLNGYGASDNAAGQDYTSDNFINNAFSESEKAAISHTLLDNQLPDFPNKEDCGNNTTDQVFLLSRGEALQPAHGFETRHMSSKTRVATNTAYEANYGTTGWWLRSKGTNGKNYVAKVGESDDGIGGYLSILGEPAGTLNYAVRPALHLNLANRSLWSHASGINSNGTEIPWVSPPPTEMKSPAPADTPTPIPTESASQAPAETTNPTPADTAPPAPSETPTPAPIETPTPAPIETPTPVPNETPTPIPTETTSPMPTETASPIPTETANPIPAETANPNPKKKAAPKTKVKTVGALKYTYVAKKGKKTAAVSGVKKKNAKSVKIPNQVKINGKSYKVAGINKNAFSNMGKLTKVTIGANVKTIGDSAFKNCKKLEFVMIPSKVSTLGKQSFAGCKKLRYIVLKTNNLRSVGSKAFQGVSPRMKVKTTKKKWAQYQTMFTGKGKMPKKSLFLINPAKITYQGKSY